MFPLASMRAIWLTSMFDSVNHMLPSAPNVMCRGSLLSVGTRNDLNCPATPAANRGPVLSTVAVGNGVRSQADATNTTATAMSHSLYFMLASRGDFRPRLLQRAARSLRKSALDRGGSS